MKPAVYIVFDQLPKKEDGGLVATYINFVEQFKDELEIKLVSVFTNGGNDIDSFNGIDIINLSNYQLDNRFFHAMGYLKDGQIRRFFHAVASGMIFFSSIPFMRKKTARLMRDKMVIAAAPAAAIFLSKKIRFILEIHTNFEYFWGKNTIGKLQTTFASKPVLTLFRNKTDAKKAHDALASDYIYNGVAEPVLESDTELLATRKRNSALFVGRLTKLKNPLFLLRCAQKVRESIPDFTLDIYGTGEMKQEIEDEITRLHLEGVVSLKGFTEDKSVYSRYEQFWLSSEFEGFGLVLVEAMANQTPVITTNWGDAVFEIVQDGKTGFIVNDTQEFSVKAIELFNDPGARERLAKKAREDYLERFSSEKNRVRWKEILSSVYPSNLI